jgi:3-oxocholest-4-en-26-oate---CoA ligase
VEFNVADLFEATADLVPAREAVVCGVHRLTYAGLDARSNALARWLLARGVRAGDHIALWLYNGVEYLEASLAAFKIRAVPLNVNYRYVPTEVEYVLRDSDAVAVIHEAEFGSTLAAVRRSLPCLRVSLASGTAYEAAVAAEGVERLKIQRSGDDWYLLYTGGTTGMPKGVIWRQEDLFFSALGKGRQFGSADAERPEDVLAAVDVERARRALPAAPFIHGTAHWSALSTLIAGDTVVVSPGRSFDPDKLWQLVSDEGVGMLVIVGDAFGRPLVDSLRRMAKPHLGALRLILSSGALLSPSVRAEFQELLPDVRVIDAFGSSETGGMATIVGGAPAGGDGGAAQGPRLVVNDVTAVLSADGAQVRRGSGDIGWLARSGHVPLGYYKDPEKTAETFRIIDGVRWAVSGDMATVTAEGSIVLLGRGSQCINTGGEKVYPEEVEAVLKEHPCVLDAIVVAVSDDRWGEAVAAVVAARQPGSLNAETVKEHARRHLARYKVPQHILFVADVPRSAPGKPDYRQARALLSAGEVNERGASVTDVRGTRPARPSETS